MDAPTFMDTLTVPNVALVVVTGQLVFKCVKKWLGRSTASRYIELAGEQFVASEQITDILDIEDVSETVDIEPKEVVRRKVKHRGLFRSYLIQVGKAKFGTPSRTGANTLCIRKFLYDECVKHGLVARHIVENLDFAVEAVYVPSKHELLAKAVRHSNTVKRRFSVSRELGGPTPSD